MFPWRELTCRKSLLDERRTLRVMDSRRRRMHVSNQGDLLLLTGLGIVHQVTQPMRVPFGTIPSSEVVGERAGMGATPPLAVLSQMRPTCPGTTVESEYAIPC
jgi:hypothetical protein